MISPRTYLRCLMAASILAALPLTAAATDTTFTYQGLLTDTGTATDAYDFQIHLFNAAQDGTPLAGPLDFTNVVPDEGRFLLEIDAGDVFTGEGRWLELWVRRSGSADDYTQLQPRQKLHATPYAQHAFGADFAAQVATGSVTTTTLADGAVTANKVDANTVQRRVNGTCDAGQAIRVVNQDGSVLCEVIPASSADWSRSGNAGTDPATDFLGTTDAQAFEIRTFNARSLRIEPSINHVEDGLPVSANIIGGSHANTISSGVVGGTIAGGGRVTNHNDLGPNRIVDHYSTVSGGAGNIAGRDDGGDFDVGYGATVGGGLRNTAAGSHATVSGGRENSAHYNSSTVPGGQLNCAGGVYSFAAGYRAKVLLGEAPSTGPCAGMQSANGLSHRGTFVWADSTEADFLSTGTNKFEVQATGGFRFVTNTTSTAGVTLPAGSGTWNSISDRNAKADFESVDTQDVLARVLALPIQTWRYTAQDKAIRHMGPTAQDFHTTFGLNGNDDKSIATVDPDGVALAAIQGLNTRLEAENAALREELSDLRHTLIGISKRLQTLENQGTRK